MKRFFATVTGLVVTLVLLVSTHATAIVSAASVEEGTANIKVTGYIHSFNGDTNDTSGNDSDISNRSYQDTPKTSDTSGLELYIIIGLVALFILFCLLLEKDRDKYKKYSQ